MPSSQRRVARVQQTAERVAKRPQQTEVERLTDVVEKRAVKLADAKKKLKEAKARA